MPILDFKEIPEAHKATGLQDTFELFARDFLSYMGYRVLTDPDRGADGGIDLIVEEKRTGVGGETLIKWLVSCKHKAHSGNSVTPTDESNIRDRVEANDCQGFIGVYSTLPSTGLSTNLEGMRQKFEYQVFDKEKIEGNLIHSTKGIEIAERYFPKSLEEWKTENPKPAQLFIDSPRLKCKVCNKELFEQEDKGIVQVWQRMREDYEKEPEYIEHIFWVCRGHCDNVLSSFIRHRNSNLMDGWDDVSDIMIPTVYMKWIMSTINNLQEGTIYSDEAFKNLKEFLLQVFPYVSRHLTSQEKERINNLGMIPSYIGGLGD